MLFRRNSHALVLVAALVPVVAGLVASPADAYAKCRKNCDRTAPTVAVVSPTSGSSVEGTVTVSGTSSDAVSVQSVAVSVDGGPWTIASGTSSWSWSWATTAVSDGSHTLTARAVDTSGNASTASVSVNVVNTVPDTAAPSINITSPSAGSTVSGTVSVSGSAADDTSVARVEVRVDGGSWQTANGTATWGWSWDTTAVPDGSHTLTARATDTAGNSATASRSVTVSNASSTTTSTGTAGTTGIWTSPEGVKIDIRTTTGGWTHDEIYGLLTSSARELSKIGPTLKVVVQDTNPTLSTVAASSSNGMYTSVSATIQLDARTTSTFSNRPDDIVAHEYGHVWFNYYAYLKWQGDWSAYLAKRWTVADGSTTLATDSRTGSSYIWTPDEIAADDYRLLFGSSLAVSERNVSLNQQIPDPRSQTGLKDWILATWAG